jgi:hypothetical protein
MLNKYAWPILALFIIIGYWYNVEGAGTTLRWCLIFAVIPILVTFRCNLNFNHVFIASSFGIGVNSIIVILQHYGYTLDLVQVSGRPSGSFLNGNLLSEVTALVIMGCIVHRLYYLLPLTVPSMLLPMHRGSMIALVIVGMIYSLTLDGMKEKTTKRFIGWLWVLLLLILILLSIISLSSRIGLDSLDLVQVSGRPSGLFLNGNLLSEVTASLSSRIGLDSIQDRFELWTFAITHLTWLGNGIGSFRIDYLNYANILDDSSYILHVHNDLLELIFEYGIFATIPVGLIILSLYTTNILRYVIMVYIIEAMSGFPTYMPTTLFIVSLCMWSCLRSWYRDSFIIWFGRIYSYTRNARARPLQASDCNTTVSIRF